MLDDFTARWHGFTLCQPKGFLVSRKRDGLTAPQCGDHQAACRRSAQVFPNRLYHLCAALFQGLWKCNIRMRKNVVKDARKIRPISNVFQDVGDQKKQCFVVVDRLSINHH